VAGEGGKDNSTRFMVFRRPGGADDFHEFVVNIQ